MTGVLLMTFGSATTAAQVVPYLRSVRRGAEPPADVVAEFERRYRLVGRSPLHDITISQALALQRHLDRIAPGAYAVDAGMLHANPSIAAGFARLAERGAGEVRGIVLAPQHSDLIMSGYGAAVAAGAAEHGIPAAIAPAWYSNASFIAALADALTATLQDFAAAERSAVPVVFTAHSLPRPVVERDPGYIDQIRATVDAVSARAGLEPGQVHFAYQSAGHSPEEWLTPDFKDLLPGFREAGHREVVLVPTQFVADHLEILYDIDIAGQEEAAAQGMTFRRIPLPNCSPAFIGALAEIAMAA